MKHLSNHSTSILTALLIGVATVCAALPKLAVKPVHDSGMPVPVLTAHDTIRVLAIRVDFQLDTLPTTSGEGRFDFGARNGRKIDPPPHDSLYFQHQFQFLNHYYHQVSEGKLTILADVYPAGNQRAYRMPEQTWYYHPDPQNEELTNRRITQLWQSAWDSAAADPSIDFGTTTTPKYDVYFVIHAGAGNEYDAGFDDTPFDIPSGFITPFDLNRYLGISDPRGLPVRNSSFFIPQGALLPEYSSQFSNGEWLDIGVGGLYAFLFGRSIGMPFLYDTEKGTSRVGRWSLMDRGFGTFFGLLPGYPDAYSRWRMGWSTPRVATLGTVDSIRIPQLNDTTMSQAIILPGSRDEFFLAEARNRDPDSLDYAMVYDADGDSAKLTNRYEIEIPPARADSFGVIVRASNYEFDTPGSGVLVWRVNQAQRQLRERTGKGWQNGEPPYVLELLEADGAKDIGQNYGFFTPGSGTETGSPYDAFFDGNSEWMYANPGILSVRLDQTSNPSSTFYNQGVAPFRLIQFSQPGKRMRFNIQSVQSLPGEIRKRLPLGNSTPLTIAFDANHDASSELWIFANDIFAFDAGGSPLGTLPVSSVLRDSLAQIDSISSLAIATFPTGTNLVTNVAAISFDTTARVLASRTIGATNQLVEWVFNTAGSTYTLLSETVVPIPEPATLLTYRQASDNWIIGFTNFDTISVALGLPVTSLAPASRSPHLSYMFNNGAVREFPGTGFDPLPRVGTAGVTTEIVATEPPFVLHNHTLYRYDSTQNGWREVAEPFVSQPRERIAPLHIGVGVITSREWWVNGVGRVATDFPRLVSSHTTPTSALVTATNPDNLLLMWYGTEDGALWHVSSSTQHPVEYPIGVSASPVTGVALLSRITSDTSLAVSVAALSTSGDLFLATVPSAMYVEWASRAGAGNHRIGYPNFLQDFSTTYSSGLQSAFVWPNPATTIANIRLAINPARAAGTTVAAYDLDGQRVATIRDWEKVDGGGVEYRWNLANCKRGIYLVRVRVPGEDVKIIRVAVIK